MWIRLRLEIEIQLTFMAQWWNMLAVSCHCLSRMLRTECYVILSALCVSILPLLFQRAFYGNVAQHIIRDSSLDQLIRRRASRPNGSTLVNNRNLFIHVQTGMDFYLSCSQMNCIVLYKYDMFERIVALKRQSSLGEVIPGGNPTGMSYLYSTSRKPIGNPLIWVLYLCNNHIV